MSQEPLSIFFRIVYIPWRLSVPWFLWKLTLQSSGISLYPRAPADTVYKLFFFFAYVCVRLWGTCVGCTCTYVSMYAEVKGWCQVSSWICFHFISWGRVLTWTQSSLKWVAYIPQGCPVSAHFVLKSQMGWLPCQLRGTWGSEVQLWLTVLYTLSHHLLSPGQTFKHHSHSLDDFLSIQLFHLVMSQF